MNNGCIINYRKLIIFKSTADGCVQKIVRVECNSKHDREKGRCEGPKQQLASGLSDDFRRRMKGDFFSHVLMRTAFSGLWRNVFFLLRKADVDVQSNVLLWVIK